MCNVFDFAVNFSIELEYIFATISRETELQSGVVQNHSETRQASDITPRRAVNLC